MEIEKFNARNEFLYHLTDRRNWEIIKDVGLLLSTELIVNQSNLNEEEKNTILRNRRPVHTQIFINGYSYFLRDQRPISAKNLSKCLTNGWTVSDFLYHLNRRVFFWPTISRLLSHYGRYAHENPIIIKVSSSSMLALNEHAEFCRLNSGATRSSSYLNGAPPERGEETFQPASLYNLPVGSVAEVTFPNTCKLPKKIFIGNNPNGPWEEMNL